MPRPPVRVALLSILLLTQVGAQSNTQSNTSSTPPLSETVIPAPPQWRGLWVDAFGPGLKTPAEISKLVAQAKALHLNVLFAQVGRRMDCYCNHTSVPRTQDPAVPQGFDPLAELIRQAHAAGLQVHAWMITTAAWNSAKPPENPQHIFNLHGPARTGENMWMTEQPDGNLKNGSDWVLDPAVPGAERYIVNMYASVVKNYAVDGVMLDRVRYPDSGTPGLANWGYNPITLARYRAETGHTGTPDPNDPAWLDWRRAQVSNMVRAITLAVKRERPTVWVDAATITYGQGPGGLTDSEANSGSTVPGGAAAGQTMRWTVSRPYREVLQDWVGWLRRGYLDASILMNYKRDFVPAQADWFSHWSSFAARVRALGRVVDGTALYLNPQASSAKQVQEALSDGLNGWAGYSSRTPDPDTYANKKSADAALSELAGRLAGPGGPLAAAATPLDRPDAAHLRAVSGTVRRNGQAAGSVTVNLLAGGQLFASTTTDGNGEYGFFYPPLGHFQVVVQGAAPLDAQAVTGQVTTLPDLVTR